MWFKAMTMAIVGGATMMAGCAGEPSWGDDAAFLARHRETITLASPDGQARIAVVPSIQGRIMTSTATGADGPGYGWINRDLIASGEAAPRINSFGGEDRFWLGPEGGQFAIFFAPGTKFTLEDWQTPAAIDTDAYRVVARDDRSVRMTHDASFLNWSGTRLHVRIDRTVRLLDAGRAAREVGVELGGARAVAFESENTITNTGASAWTRQTGLLSVWILGMFKPSDLATAVIPVRPGSDGESGQRVKDDYFGKVPADRLRVTDRHAFFKADGLMRSKIGVSPRRATPACGAWDAGRNVLTVVHFSLPTDARDYVNSMWELQKDPFAGDAINSYNDGPSTPGGKPFGPFFELETSSPAAALGPDQSLTHTHRTMHFTGPREELDRLSKALLGVGLTDIERSLAP